MSGSLASGVNRRISIGRQTALKTRASADAGEVLRRITSEQNLAIDNFQSQEILPSQQIRETRNGPGRGSIAYASQLAPGAQKHFFEGILRRQFAIGPTLTAATIAAASGPPGTFTRSSGSWLTDGFRLGMVVRCTGWAAPATANNSRNFRVIGLTATVMTVSGVGDETVVAKAAGDSVTIAMVGKATYIPASGQVAPYYTYEDYIADIASPRADVYEDCRVQSVGLNISPSGMTQISAQLQARDVKTLPGAPYFTSPAPASTIQSVTGTTGLIRANGADIALMTSLQLQMASQTGGDPVVGENRLPDIFTGIMSVQGSGQMYLQDYSFFDLFKNETEFEVMLMLKSDPTVNSHFIAITLPRCRITGLNKSDGPMQLMQRFSLMALENTGASTPYEWSTIIVQDSSL